MKVIVQSHITNSGEDIEPSPTVVHDGEKFGKSLQQLLDVGALRPATVDEVASYEGLKAAKSAPPAKPGKAADGKPEGEEK